MPKEERLKRGERIPGSVYYRAYCDRCDEPMRVDFDDILKLQPFYCERCAPRPPKINLKASKEDDAGPWYENALRALEDRLERI